MAITMEQIKNLRDVTGISITACKKALEEADGDEEKAIEYLRKKGEAKSADRAERAASEGVVAVSMEGRKAAVVDLRCETDFVARDETFINLASELAKKLYDGDIGSDETEIESVKDAGIKLGENVKVEGMKVIEGDVLGSYVHSNKKIGVVVSLKGGNEDLARDISMHIAATNPQVIAPDEVDDALVAKEKEIWAEQLKNEGKPEEIIDKIMIGKEKKFREENALIKQDFVKDPEKTIEQLLKDNDAEILEFARMGA